MLLAHDGVDLDYDECIGVTYDDVRSDPEAALGAIEPWEIALAVLINVVAIWLLLEFGGRVYSGAVLQTGARMRLRDAWRASKG